MSSEIRITSADPHNEAKNLYESIIIFFIDQRLASTNEKKTPTVNNKYYLSCRFKLVQIERNT